MKAVQSIFIEAYYRKNYLFFALVLIFLGLVFRPPTLLVSPMFIPPMFESPTFFLTTIIILSAYLAKAWRESYRNLYLPENSCLFILGGLPIGRIWRILFLQMLAVMAPATIYLLLISGYSLMANSWHAALCITLSLGTPAIAAMQLTNNIIRPREKEIRRGIQAWVEGRFKNSLSFVALETLWTYHSRELLISKGISIGLIIISALAHQQSPFPPKAYRLILLSIIILQIMLPYRLRRSEDKLIFDWRNLPLSRVKRYGAYLLTAIIIFIPDSLCLLFFSSQDTINMMGLTSSYMLLGIGIFMQGVAILYYKPHLPTQYAQWFFGVYIVIFFIILYGFQLWLPALLSLVFSSWIFFEEFYTWNGWED